MAGIGHNRPPEPIEAPSPLLPAGAACCRCTHWKAPCDRDVRDFDYWKATGKGRRVKQPTGACDRVRMNARSAPAFSATSANSQCFNYEARPIAPYAPTGRGFVTIYEAGRIVWQGTEGDEPAQYRQEELQL